MNDQNGYDIEDLDIKVIDGKATVKVDSFARRTAKTATKATA
jgi:hypothetical protein